MVSCSLRIRLGFSFIMTNQFSLALLSVPNPRHGFVPRVHTDVSTCFSAQTGLRSKFSCPEAEAVVVGADDSAGFDPKNANNVTMALISLARKTKVSQECHFLSGGTHTAVSLIFVGSWHWKKKLENANWIHPNAKRCISVAGGESAVATSAAAIRRRSGGDRGPQRQGHSA